MSIAEIEMSRAVEDESEQQLTDVRREFDLVCSLHADRADFRQPAARFEQRRLLSGYVMEIRPRRVRCDMMKEALAAK